MATYSQVVALTGFLFFLARLALAKKCTEYTLIMSKVHSR
jgi:hypothetical protein